MPAIIVSVAPTAFFSSPREYKVDAISAIIQRFPRSVFVLVGDSGEQDPEAYGEIGRRYPERVGAIFIRDVSVGESQAGVGERHPGEEARQAHRRAGLPVLRAVSDGWRQPRACR